MKTLLFLSVLAAASYLAQCHVDSNCMKAICEQEGCDRLIGSCNPDGGSDSCGPYQIKEAYWIDCGRPGNGWRECTKQKDCSEGCVQSYMQRYLRGCTISTSNICEKYARLHNGGPSGCSRASTNSYWTGVEARL